VIFTRKLDVFGSLDMLGKIMAVLNFDGSITGAM